MSNLLMLFDGIHLEGGIPMALFYAGFGFLFVFSGIVFLILFFTVLGIIMKKVNARKDTVRDKKEESRAELSAPVPVAPVIEEGISPELVAVITAAIAVTLEGTKEKGDFVVRRIKRL